MFITVTNIYNRKQHLLVSSITSIEEDGDVLFITGATVLPVQTKMAFSELQALIKHARSV